MCVLSLTHPPRHDSFGSTPCNCPCPLVRGWIALGAEVIDPLLIGGNVVLLARGTRRSCVGGKNSRFWRRTPHATPALSTYPLLYFVAGVVRLDCILRPGSCAWILQGFIQC
ncbi:unnamed protein product [Ectocarpus sp. 12 AP-2014]